MSVAYCGTPGLQGDRTFKYFVRAFRAADQRSALLECLGRTPVTTGRRRSPWSCSARPARPGGLPHGTLLALVFAGVAQAQLAGVVDIHVHADPDSVPRSIDAFDLAKLAQQKGMRALVLKSHYEPTASLAWSVRKIVPGIEVFGGIDLNRSVGGVNAAAVERMVLMKGGWGRVVWMPTFDAENQVRYSKENRPFVSVAKGGVLLPEVRDVIAVVAKNKLTLETGHSSAAECLMLIREARKAGVERIVVTHAAIAPVRMTVAQMKEGPPLHASGHFRDLASNADSLPGELGAPCRQLRDRVRIAAAGRRNGHFR